jgi:hypothetical protein
VNISLRNMDMPITKWVELGSTRLKETRRGICIIYAALWCLLIIRLIFIYYQCCLLLTKDEQQKKKLMMTGGVSTNHLLHNPIRGVACNPHCSIMKKKATNQKLV